MAKKNKKPTIKGAKQRAGILLSSFLRDILEEKTEVNDSIEDPQMISKAEKIARLMVKHAIGFTETRINDKDVAYGVVHQPDRTYIAMVWDRAEGRVAAVESGKKEKRTVADRIGDQSKKRINAAAKKAVE